MVCRLHHQVLKADNTDLLPWSMYRGSVHLERFLLAVLCFVVNMYGTVQQSGFALFSLMFFFRKQVLNRGIMHIEHLLHVLQT